MPSAGGERVLRTGKIIDADESPAAMIERVVGAVFVAEQYFGTNPSVINALEQDFGEMCDSGQVVLSTPVLTNAGKHSEKPLTACTMPPVDLRGDLGSVRTMIDTLHQQGMGTGFNLGETEDPVAILAYLNEVAVSGSESGKEDRPVGNMAILSVRHPKIREFIDAKRGSAHDGSNWKFNISVDVDDEFMQAVESDGGVRLNDGTWVKATDIFNQISEAAYLSADPGLIFLDRMNLRNPTPGVSLYQTTAPCAEVGLAPGETCQFGYINLGKMTKENAAGVVIDYERLAVVAAMMTRVLDNCLEVSLLNYTTPGSESIMRLKRKIGVGVCGVADLLVRLGIPYSSDQAVDKVQSVISWVNYQTTLASVELAKSRGSCDAMGLINVDPDRPMNRHTADPTLLHTLFGDKDTEMVSGDDWSRLGLNIKNNRSLRNVTTTALPPTGRSGLVIDASTGIEPHFSFTNPEGRIHKSIEDYLRANSVDFSRFLSIQNGTEAPTEAELAVISVCEKATAISALSHLQMAIGAQEVIDEAVSKTVNMPAGTEPSDVRDIYYHAWQGGMTGITMYREGTHLLQPVKLGDKK